MKKICKITGERREREIEWEVWKSKYHVSDYEWRASLFIIMGKRRWWLVETVCVRLLFLLDPNWKQPASSLTIK